MPYKINTSSGAQRDNVASALFGLDLVSPATREKMITAWVSTWTSSDYKDFEKCPWDPMIDDYPLITHVNEVTRTGLDLAERAAKEWNVTLDPEILLPILCLHDVDKPLMFVRRGNQNVHSELYSQIPHGVVGAMLLKELDFPPIVYSTVGAHSPRMPFPGKNYEAFVLHYADHFACDNALIRNGKKPIYFHLKLPEKH